MLAFAPPTDLVLHFPHSDIYSFAPVILASRASTLEEKGNGQFILNEDGTISPEFRPTFVLAWDPASGNDTPATVPPPSGPGTSASAKIGTAAPVSTNTPPTAKSLECVDLAVVVEGQRGDATEAGANEPNEDSQNLKADSHAEGCATQHPAFDPHAHVLVEDWVVEDGPRSHVDNPLHAAVL